MLFLITLTFLIFTKRVLSDINFPSSPCPSMFYYEANGPNDVHGVLRFKNDLSGNYKVELTMSLAAFTNQNIKIKRVTSIPAAQNGDDIVYHIIFPISNPVPEVTSIVFNNNIHCHASQVRDQGSGVTTLNALDFFGTPRVFKQTFYTPSVVQPVNSVVVQQTYTTPQMKPLNQGSYVVPNTPPPQVQTINQGSYSGPYTPPPQIQTINQGSYSGPYTPPPQIQTINQGSYNGPYTPPPQIQTINQGSYNGPYTQPPQMQTINQMVYKETLTTSKVQTIDPAGSKQTLTTPYMPPLQPITVSHVVTKTTNEVMNVTVVNNRHLVEYECGIAEDDIQALLVHGKATSEGQYPWLTALFHLQEEEYKFKCAGSLVSNKHIITAAHCVHIDKTTVISKENIILVLGKHNIRSWAVRSEIRDVRKIYVHPEYNQPSDADVAIILMYKQVEFTEKIKPVCLWEEEGTVDAIVGNNGTVVGWGRDEFDNAYVPEPRQLDMPVVSQEDCLRSDERFLKLTSHRTFCAGTKKGEGACTGDSGGGFIMRRGGKWTLRGIVSSALVDPRTRSCDVYNYMVFADISKFLPWVSRLMSK